MIVMVISLNSVLALDFEFNSPDEVQEGQEFSVSIDLDIEEEYDVKVFAYNGNIQNIISEVYFAGKWSNPFYYLKSVFPENKQFKIKISDFTGDAEICSRLRKTGQTNYGEVCNEIKVLESGKKTNNEEEKEVEEIINYKTENIEESYQQTSYQNISKKKEKIILNKPNNKNSDEKTKLSPYGLVREYIIYGFTFILVILLVLVVLKKM